MAMSIVTRPGCGTGTRPTAPDASFRVEAKIILDGGAYASTTSAVTANAAYFAVGPYKVDTAIVDGYGVRTNNPPNGAMRGFGAVQSCFGYESQMDRARRRHRRGPSRDPPPQRARIRRPDAHERSDHRGFAPGLARPSMLWRLSRCLVAAPPR